MLLSICIPTYNRASFLKVMLQALLPQAAEHFGEVEVWVLDNGSTDGTAQVVEESRRLGSLYYCRNETNLGPLENVIKGPRDLANGDFVWVLGDHNLMRPGALTRVLAALRSRAKLDIFYANFRCATFPGHWPDNAAGGFDGPFSYLGNAEISDGPVAHWFDLLTSQSALCTQVYVHIVRTRIWKEYWKTKSVPAPYTNALSTYPHTCTIADSLFHAPAGRIADPVLTIFNGAQSWGDPETQFKVYSVGFPDLLTCYRRRGLTGPKLAEGRDFCRQQVQKVAQQLLSRPGAGILTALHLPMRAGTRKMWLWPAIWRGFMDAQNAKTSIGLRKAHGVCHRWHRYWFHDCRPARLLRARRSSPGQ